MNNDILAFFANSDSLDYMVLRPLSHINMNWELTWNTDNNEYEREEGTLASLLNDLISEISITTPPIKYHNNEDCLAEYVRQSLNWNIYKQGGKWFGEDYDSIIEQGGFSDLNEHELVQAATGRVWAAVNRDQYCFDEMEESHQRMLGAIMSIIIYHRQSISDGIEFTL